MKIRPDYTRPSKMAEIFNKRYKSLILRKRHVLKGRAALTQSLVYGYYILLKKFLDRLGISDKLSYV